MPILSHHRVPLSVLIWVISLAQFTPAFAQTGQDHTLLLVDDHHVLYRSGTRRVLNQPVRHAANPLIESTKPWEVAIAWMSVFRHPETGKYQLWYQAYAGNVANDKTRTCVVCYAESDDGIHFVKPDLDLFDFNGVKPTNIVLVGNGGRSTRYANSVVFDPRDPDPARRYKMGYYDFGTEPGNERPGLFIAFSPDGIHWTKHSRSPLLPTSYGNHGEPVPMRGDDTRPWAVPLSMSDAVDIFYDPNRGVFAHYGKMWLDGPAGGMYYKHGLGRTESRDFIHWSRPKLILTPDDLDAPTVEFHTSPVFFHKGVYFSLNQILDRGVGGGVIDIELMTSRDGINWQRPFRRAFNQPFFIERAPGNAFDSGSIFTCATPIVLKDEIRFYYGGYSQGATSADDHTHVSGVGMASIPLDRFAGITPVAESKSGTLREPLHHIGQVTMRAIDLKEVERISLNADASAPGGAIRVEILDADGRRMPGFTRDDAIVITGDSLSHAVRWRDRSIRNLPDGEYHLRIHLEKATIYTVMLACEAK